MVYYIDPHYGKAAADGKTPETARATYTDLALEAGDTVLFRRGSFLRERLIRQPGKPGAYITYGAYGDGANPVFCGAVDVSEPADWEETEPHIWRYRKDLGREAGNFIFDHGRIGGTLRWNREGLHAPGDWYDERIGTTVVQKTMQDAHVYLWCAENPGTFYRHIECACWGNLSDNRDWTITEDLCFLGSGVHGFSGGASHMVVRRCSFCFIGGAVWHKGLHIRFGNAIEFWERGEDIRIEDCYFYNIYDSAITQQGSALCEPAKRIIMRHNLFVEYGMAAYEGRDRMPVACEFTDNLCIRAGGGFSAFGDTRPRQSEIFPQPMGHHIFLWRIPAPSADGSFLVARNWFHMAAGAAVYSIIDPAAEAQMTLAENRYYTGNSSLFQQMNGRGYAPEDWNAWTECGRESAPVWKDMDDAAAQSAWFAATKTDRCGMPLASELLPPRRYFAGSTDREPLSYRVGEEMVFRLRMTDENGVTGACDRFRLHVEKEHGEISETWVSGASGETEVRTHLDAPGFVYVQCTPCDAAGTPLPDWEPFDGGACAGFETILETTAEPADFDAFWQRVIQEELDTVPPVALERTETRLGDPADILYDMKIACPGPNPVSGYLRMPRNAAPGSLSLVVGFDGYGVRSAPIPGKANCIQFFVNQTGDLNGQEDAYYKTLSDGYGMYGWDEKENADPDTAFFKYVLLRALQAVRYAKTLPEWDGKSITVVGGSMGGFQTVFASAWEKAVTHADISVPWMCDLHGRENGRLHGWRPENAAGLDYYDTVYHAARLQCTLAVKAGLGDTICPPSGVVSLFHAVQCPTVFTAQQDCTHSQNAPAGSMDYKRERNR